MLKTIIKVLVMLVLAVALVCSSAVLIAFKGTDITPEIFGKIFYIYQGDKIVTLVDTTIPEESIVVALDTRDYQPDDIVLYKIGEEKFIGRVSAVTENGYNIQNGTDDLSGYNPEILIKDVVGVCVSYNKSTYGIINFMQGLTGIVGLIILPGLILLLMILIPILSSRSSYDIEKDFEKYGTEPYKSGKNPKLLGNPADYKEDDEFKKKKASLYDNFGQKLDPEERPKAPVDVDITTITGSKKVDEKFAPKPTQLDNTSANISESIKKTKKDFVLNIDYDKLDTQPENQTQKTTAEPAKMQDISKATTQKSTTANKPLTFEEKVNAVKSDFENGAKTAQTVQTAKTETSTPVKNAENAQTGDTPPLSKALNLQGFSEETENTELAENPENSENPEINPDSPALKAQNFDDLLKNIEDLRNKL
jgi:hypothetical protein